MPETSEGGTGQPTTGSGGLSVPIGVHYDALRAADKELMCERDRRYNERNHRQDDALHHLERMHENARQSDKEAVDKAFASATKLSEAHNDLLRKMEKLTEQFATRDVMNEALTRSEKAADGRLTRIESWQARFSGGLVVVAFIGLANFVKLWTG